MILAAVYSVKKLILHLIKVRALLILITLSFAPFNASRAANDYLVGPGDVVKINVFDYPDLSIETRVSESGRITFPLLGEIIIGGKTPAEAEKLIAEALSTQDIIRQPHVSLVVSQFVSQQASILGYVQTPGKYVLDKQISLLELLALAGGVTSDGEDRALLTRTVSGKTEKIEIDLYELFHGDHSRDLPIKSGDIVYVMKSKVFYIYGEVQHPGMFRLQRLMNVAQAISTGGGLTPKGTDHAVKVKRRIANGEFRTETAELGDLVQPDDVVYVRESWF
jgi:polysaccharide biosynthesis/export protein